MKGRWKAFCRHSNGSKPWHNSQWNTGPGTNRREAEEARERGAHAALLSAKGQRLQAAPNGSVRGRSNPDTSHLGAHDPLNLWWNIAALQYFVGDMDHRAGRELVSQLTDFQIFVICPTSIPKHFGMS